MQSRQPTRLERWLRVSDGWICERNGKRMTTGLMAYALEQTGQQRSVAYTDDWLFLYAPPGVDGFGTVGGSRTILPLPAIAAVEHEHEVVTAGAVRKKR